MVEVLTVRCTLELGLESIGTTPYHRTHDQTMDMPMALALCSTTGYLVEIIFFLPIIAISNLTYLSM